jgi:hypothetical protein
MKTFREGELVSVERDGETVDGMVAHVENLLKIVVAVPDPERGAIIRTVHPRVLSERADPGPDDHALERAIERIPGGRGGARGGGSGGRGSRGYGRTTGHRRSGAS